MRRLVLAFLCAAAACALVASAVSTAQNPSTPFPDAFVGQVTNSVRQSATNLVGSYAGDISANGRFVVIESNGDIATEKISIRPELAGITRLELAN